MKTRLISIVSKLTPVEMGLLAVAGILVASIVVLLGLDFFAGHNFTGIALPKFDARPAEDPGIAFVTPTPFAGPQIKLTEGQRTQSGANGLPMQLIAPEVTPAPYFADANEMGKIMVLEYHRIGYPEMRYQRTPENFAADLQRLWENGFYPVNFSDVVAGLDTVPAGKKPVVLTFDDSDISQFRVLDDRTVDANSALGVLLNFHQQHPTDWPMRGTFFVLGDDTGNYRKIFGQPEWAQQKLQVLVDLGMEIGSHTVNHTDLSRVSAERIEWELAVSQHVIEDLVPGYQVETLSVPYGGFPWSTDFFVAGYWEDYSYTYSGNAAAWGGPAVSPHSPEFDPYRVSRIEVSDIWADHWFSYFEQNPAESYIADGDPNRITFPQTTETELAAGE